MIGKKPVIPPRPKKEIIQELDIKPIEQSIEEDINDDLYNIEKALIEDDEPVESAEEVIMEDFSKTTLSDYDNFDERCWNKGDGYKIPSFPEMEAKLEGVESGLYLFAGESNSGKSALMMNILKDMCSHRPNKLFGIYYSLDDSKHEIIPRIIAMEQSIPIAAASKPKRFENMMANCENDNIALYDSYLKKRKAGLEKLKSEVDIFKIEDAEKIKNSTDLRNHAIKLQTYVKSIDPEMNIIVAIDAINDIHLDPKEFGRIQGNDEMKEIAKFAKDLSTSLDCIIFSSSHLRKLNGNRRPTVDDLKEANTLLYEASVVWLVYNDVSKNKGGAKIYWNDTNVDNKMGAVIEIDWGKNKKSSFKGRTFCMFMPYYSKCKEGSKEDMDRWEALIYQN